MDQKRGSDRPSRRSSYRASDIRDSNRRPSHPEYQREESRALSSPQRHQAARSTHISHPSYDHQRYQNTNRNRRQQAPRRSPNARPPKSKLPIVIAILIAIALVCIIRFVACAPADDKAQDATIADTPSSTSNSTPSEASQPAALTANMHNRDKTSDSANDVKPSEKVVYLTFDDGPSEHTEQILDILDRYGIKATWFILGNTGNIDKVKEIWDRGHQIGLHSAEHDYEYVYASPDNFVADINEVGAAVRERIGFMPTLIRFPGGSVNGYNTGRADAFKQAAAEHGWHYFDWNVSIGDSTQPPAPVEQLVENIKREAEGCNSANVLMHDSDFKPTTPDALPQIIEYFIDEGYSFDVIGADSFGYHF